MNLGLTNIKAQGWLDIQIFFLRESKVALQNRAVQQNLGQRWDLRSVIPNSGHEPRVDTENSKCGQSEELRC